MFRKTTVVDLDTVMEIYAYARRVMREGGNPDQWGDTHPTREMVEDDIKRGVSYVYEKGGLIGAVFYFAVENDPTYAQIDGAWLNGEPYGVIHRIARARHAKGAGAACMDWCQAQCGNIRIDTHKANTPMLVMLEKLGFTRCGLIRLGLFDNPEWDERVAFQKVEPRLMYMKELITRLQAASRAYYHENREIMSDREYDALYDELVQLEAETGTILAESLTRKVGYKVVSALVKVAHVVPMLSLDKTKNPEALVTFLNDAPGLLTWKLDGLALSLFYENGVLKQALTRGNGQVGEDVTHNARVFINLPKKVANPNPFTVRGEAVITYADFEKINENLPPEEAYKNPRSLCSGTVRQLNSEVAAARKVHFYAIGLNGNAPDGFPANLKSEQLTYLAELGFTTVPHQMVTAASVTQAVEDMKQQITTAAIATDGLVLTLNDIGKSRSLGATSKFPRDSIAFKWTDELQTTTLREIEWNTSRTGLINPIAIFDPVELEGTSVSRAGLHNVSILRDLQLCIGDRITVYKANMIIPQVSENLSRNKKLVTPLERYRSRFLRRRPVPIPCFCPVCDGETEIVSGPSGETLHCTDTNCSAQQLQTLSHFVSRDAMNIEGLSEQTLEKLITLGAVSSYPHLFHLQDHEEDILELEGFGQKSYTKLMQAIEKSKNIPLPNLIYALGIRHVGLANAKLLCTHFNHDLTAIITACADENYMERLSEIKGYGEAIATALHHYFSDETNINNINKITPLLHFPTPTTADPTNLPLNGLTFVITGDVHHFKNRKDLQNHIESKGGKVTGSVTAKTSFLINNNATSTSGKNKKAAELGVPILTEEGLMQKCN